jgi:hypothetical protein
MRASGLAILLVARAALAECPPPAKPFECHAEAARRHLAGEIAVARGMYQAACALGYTPSCNNLGVLQAIAGEDPTAAWKVACRPLATVPCENLRRWKTHREMARRLVVDDADASRACAAGDVFRCEDQASRARVAALYAEECRAGEMSVCFEAGTRTGDGALVRRACDAGEGAACHALATRAPAPALWERACRDEGFDVTAEDRAARASACRAWGGRRAAETAAHHCAAGDAEACWAAKDLFQSAGDARRAFALVKAMCDAAGDPEMPACVELGDRYVTGNGTPRSLEMRRALLGDDCGPPSPWEVCRTFAEHGVRRRDPSAPAIHARWCKDGNAEACYLGALAAETHRELRCVAPGWWSLSGIDNTYERACRAGLAAACRRRAGLCRRAMDEYVRDVEACIGGGVGDGTWQPSDGYRLVRELCPESAWTPAVRRRIAAEEAYGRRLEDGPR